jgi:beta-lactam-binding protein with PASTA domain
VPLPVPPDVEAALAAVPAARARFDALPPEQKDAWIGWVGRARTRRGRVRRTSYLVQRLGPAPQAAAVEEVPLPPEPAWWPWLVVLALALVVAGVLIWLLAFRDNGNGTRSAVVVQKGTVPNVVGQPQATAVAAVKKAGLQPVVTSRQAPQPAGIVIEQQPGPGKVLKAGAAVDLVVSRGPPPVTVPDVKGLAAADAVAKLQQAKLAPRLVEVKSEETAGTVVAQNPPPGSKTKPGSRVILNVSKGAGKVTVPAVVGETVAQATSELQAAGFKPQTTNVASSQPKGTVIAQTPRGGEAAVKGSTVKLEVSQGAATTTTATTTQRTTTAATTTTATTTQATGGGGGTIAVPSLVGKGIATALQQLETAGLRATVKYVSSQTPAGQVRGQNPKAGTKVAPKTPVQLNVSEGPNPGNPTPVPDETGQDEATARSDLENAGFKVVVIRRTGGGQSGTVVEQQPAAGTSVPTDEYVAIYVAQ